MKLAANNGVTQLCSNVRMVVFSGSLNFNPPLSQSMARHRLLGDKSILSADVRCKVAKSNSSNTHTHHPVHSVD